MKAGSYQWRRRTKVIRIVYVVRGSWLAVLGECLAIMTSILLTRTESESDHSFIRIATPHGSLAPRGRRRQRRPRNHSHDDGGSDECDHE